MTRDVIIQNMCYPESLVRVNASILSPEDNPLSPQPLPLPAISSRAGLGRQVAGWDLTLVPGRRGQRSRRARPSFLALLLEGWVGHPWINTPVNRGEESDQQGPCQHSFPKTNQQSLRDQAGERGLEAVQGCGGGGVGKTRQG